MNSWTCNGIPKVPNYPENPHEPCTNYTPNCVICGLPEEALKNPSRTVLTDPQKKGSKSAFPLAIVIAAIFSLLIVGGVGLFFFFNQNWGFNTSSNKNQNGSNTTDTNNSSNSSIIPSPFISDNAINNQVISQGERILLDPNAEKQNGATSFAQENWRQALADFDQAITLSPNDPEAQIYRENAAARDNGNPLVIAVVTPISSSPDSAKEILRGVATYQEEFNQSPPSGRFLEVVIVDNSDTLISSSLAQDLIKATEILGVLGYGVDPSSQKAIQEYNNAGLAVLSPLTTTINQDILQTISPDQKTNQLLTNYLQAVSKTLSEYASNQNSPLKSVIFYNSDSTYSLQLKEELIKAIPQFQGQVLQEVDISNNNDFSQEVANVNQQGANTIFLALSKNKVSDAVSIAQANAALPSPMAMLGGDELYNPDILIQGDNAIANLTLAVPWSFSPNDPFAQDAVQSWKGRVSWRTATAYDAAKALGEAIIQDPTRSGTNSLLNQGITLTGSNTDFNIFNEVPLVKAIKGTSGPPGSNYQFESLNN
jgi:ABC-type branched-subunit amino acid transport system substrate-binding protein